MDALGEGASPRAYSSATSETSVGHVRDLRDALLRVGRDSCDRGQQAVLRARSPNSETGSGLVSDFSRTPAAQTSGPRTVTEPGVTT